VDVYYLIMFGMKVVFACTGGDELGVYRMPAYYMQAALFLIE
jgi:hypothetical protein